MSDNRALFLRCALRFLNLFFIVAFWSNVSAGLEAREDDSSLTALITHISQHSYRTSKSTNTDFCIGLLKDISAQTNIEFIEPIIETNNIGEILKTANCDKSIINMNLIYPGDTNYYSEPVYRLYDVNLDGIVDNATSRHFVLFEIEGFFHISSKPNNYIPYIGGIKEYRILDMDNCEIISYSIGLHNNWQVVVEPGTDTHGLSTIHGWSGVIRYQGKTGVYHFLPSQYPNGRFVFVDLSQKRGWGTCKFVSDKYLLKFKK